MGLFEKILVPVDGSRYSLNAVCLAARLAKIHGSELLIVHVIDDSLLDQLARFSEKNRAAVQAELRSSAMGFLSDMRCEASKQLVATTEVQIREGIPHEVILEEAAAWGADLIIMGKLGRRGVAQVLLGSVAERVIEFAEIPVLVLKGECC